MYSLHLSPEQLQIRDTVRDFVAQKIKPLALEPARLEASSRPLLLETLERASQLGLRTLALSEDLGGAGADNLTCCIVIEELAVGDADVAAVLGQTSTLARALFESLMTPEQRARFLPAFLADHRHHIAITSLSPSTKKVATLFSVSTITGRRRASCVFRPPPYARAMNGLSTAARTGLSVRLLRRCSRFGQASAKKAPPRCSFRAIRRA